jgi:dipeptidyl aminopeptidase/acylaminoacyl peptidase
LVDSDSRDWPGFFSPDATKLAFLSERGGWRPELWLANVDGSGLTQLTRLNAAEVDGGSWSPDGRQVALDASVDGNSDIYVMPQDGGRSLRLTSERSVDRRPAWSRDGEWIYFSSDRTGRWEIWRVPSNGGKSHQVTHGGGFEPVPGLDGKTLYFLRGGGPGDGYRPGAIVRMPVSGGPEEVILDRVWFAKWSVTVNGIAFLRPEQGHDVIEYTSSARGPSAASGAFRFAWFTTPKSVISTCPRMAVLRSPA